MPWLPTEVAAQQLGDVMLRTLTVLVVGTLMLMTTAMATPEIASHRRVMECHKILLPDRRDKERIARFIRCAGKAWGAPGTDAYWLSIARCESGLYWRSYNPNGHGGIYQHDTDVWPDRAHKYLDPLGLHNTNWWNPEANVIVAMRMTHADGTWTPAWSCG